MSEPSRMPLAWTRTQPLRLVPSSFGEDRERLKWWPLGHRQRDGLSFIEISKSLLQVFSWRYKALLHTQNQRVWLVFKTNNSASEPDLYLNAKLYFCSLTLPPAYCKYLCALCHSAPWIQKKASQLPKFTKPLPYLSVNLSLKLAAVVMLANPCCLTLVQHIRAETPISLISYLFYYLIHPHSPHLLFALFICHVQFDT